VLLKYNELEETEYEYKENLEQLRFLMNDIDISLIEVEYSGSEINTEQDLKKWREINNHE
jgi:CMP-2-keto-3-deoxyoctulosonic acid synthetase